LNVINVRENIKTIAKDIVGYHRLKHKKWLHDECPKFLDQWKQAKLQYLQTPSQIIGGNRQNLRRETRRTFKKRKENMGKTK
jgi:hypothetical protein